MGPRTNTGSCANSDQHTGVIEEITAIELASVRFRDVLRYGSPESATATRWNEDMGLLPVPSKTSDDYSVDHG